MIIKLRHDVTKKELDVFKKFFSERELKLRDISQENHKTYCVIGDTTVLDDTLVKGLDAVLEVTRITKPYKLASKEFHPEPTLIHVGSYTIGEGKFCIIAGPCSVETKAQISSIAGEIKKSGAHILRGGAFKPRTSPYSYEGLGNEAIDLLVETKKETGLPIISELTDVSMIDRFNEDVDIILIGSRNMQNYQLLKEVASKTNKPIMLKRGLSATVDEWLMSAEYIMQSGNPNVILCERGIRTFDNFTRSTLDMQAVLEAKRLSHLPVFIDPSHASGRYDMVEALSRAALALGADGIIVEVHNEPEQALCDGPQSLKPQKFDSLMKNLRQIAPMVGKEIE